jgi:hypothetical protein
MFLLQTCLVKSNQLPLLKILLIGNFRDPAGIHAKIPALINRNIHDMHISRLISPSWLTRMIFSLSCIRLFSSRKSAIRRCASSPVSPSGNRKSAVRSTKPFQTFLRSLLYFPICQAIYKPIINFIESFIDHWSELEFLSQRFDCLSCSLVSADINRRDLLLGEE